MLLRRSWLSYVLAVLSAILLMGGYPSTDCRDYQTGDGGNGGDGGWPPLPPPTHEHFSWTYSAPPGGWPEPSPYPEAEQAALSICGSLYPTVSLVEGIRSDLDSIRDRFATAYPCVATPFVSRWNSACLHAAFDTLQVSILLDTLSAHHRRLDSLMYEYYGSYCSVVRELRGSRAWLDARLMKESNMHPLARAFAVIPIFDTVAPCRSGSKQLEWPPLCLWSQGPTRVYYFLGPCGEPYGNARDTCVFNFASTDRSVALSHVIALDDVWQSPSTRPKWVDTFLIARNNWRAWPLVARDNRP